MQPSYWHILLHPYKMLYGAYIPFYRAKIATQTTFRRRFRLGILAWQKKDATPPILIPQVFRSLPSLRGSYLLSFRSNLSVTIPLPSLRGSYLLSFRSNLRVTIPLPSLRGSYLLSLRSIHRVTTPLPSLRGLFLLSTRSNLWVTTS